MTQQGIQIKPERIGGAAAAASMIAAFGTGATCIGWLLGLVFGIGGLGWLAQYEHLRVSASLLTAALLATGFYLLYFRPDCPCGNARRNSRILLWIATVLAVVINIVEYVILPMLG